jgi:hypothetical protein
MSVSGRQGRNDRRKPSAVGIAGPARATTHTGAAISGGPYTVRVGSPQLGPLEVEQDPQERLRVFAGAVRRGEVDP